MNSSASAAVSFVEKVDEDGVVTYEPKSIPQPTQPAKLPAAVEQVLAATEVSLRKRARIALKSGYLPTSVYTEEQVLMIARAGEELGLPFISSLRSISLVEGKISLEATLMRALVLRKVKGSRIIFRECSSQRCLVEMSRPSASITVEYTIEDAARAELLKKSVWKKNPISMLIARASAIGCRAIFGDVLFGGNAYDPDELGDEESMSDQDVEIEQCRQEIEALAVALPEEKRNICLSQTRNAVLLRNGVLLQKIRNRVKSLLDSPPVEEPTDKQRMVNALPGEAVTETTDTHRTQEEIES